MDPIKIIEKYYHKDSALYDVLIRHSESVARKALAIVDAHPELHVDREFVREAAMLHDIGVYLCDAPGIYCTGTEPYIRHGVLGAEILRREGLERHALVCERHTGSGITLKQIVDENLPLPHRDMLPLSIEEKLVCYADKFFSKSGSMKEKSLEKVRKSMASHGDDSLKRFEDLHQIFD